MPRKAEPQLHPRILQAARKLFIKGGEKSLSMRSLAKAARTNTPAVYRRFRNRNAILQALAEQYRQNAFEVLQPCNSLPEMAQALLGLALRSPREYQLFYSELISRAPGARSNFEFAKKRCMEWMGGEAEDHRELVLAISALVHGTAMLIISGAIPPQSEEKMRTVFTAAVKVLLQNAGSLRHSA
jgi:AcrR family transcriptional regulator